jgi:MinD superfamily P-loop ATPase containing an inserted ferredoxin domain
VKKTRGNVKTLTIISGKGGTGKTSIVASFAVLAKNAVLADCDVDAADLSLIIDAQLKTASEFKASQKARIDVAKCIQCGDCEHACHFNAIRESKVDPFLCEGCRVCSLVCPQEAISMDDVCSGQLFVSDTPYGPLVHARLEPGEENSGKLVTLVRQTAEQIARDEGFEYIIVDGPPGIGCPVIASLSGATASLIVTEPTLSAISDLKVLSVCNHFKVPAFVCVNRCDLYLENVRRITEFCQQEGVEILGLIPYDLNVVRALVHGKPVVCYTDSAASQQITKLWGQLAERVTLL